jgi:hypothetical protein
MRSHPIIDRLASFFGFGSLLQVKDRYGFRDKHSPFEKGDIICRVYYSNALEGILRALMRRTRSASIIGDLNMRMFYVDHTEQYWMDRQAVSKALPKAEPRELAENKVEPAPISIH